MPGVQLGHLAHHHGTIQAGVGGNPEQRSGQRGLEHVDTLGLVTLQLGTQTVQRRTGLHQGATATGHNALFHGCLGRRDGVLDAMLALLEGGVGGGADLDHGNTAGQLGQTLLQLLAVPVRVGGFDLRLQLGDTCLDGLLGAATVDDDRLVLAHHDAAGGAQHLDTHLTQRQTHIGVDHLGVGDDGQVLQECLAAVAEERRLDGDGLEGLANRVDHQGRQRLTLHVLGHDQ
ncbi:Uncharacterised protein [Mycobacteroides abscessus subsp. massiliense]|nr:Uncharacterised protein [Mycobacteroides abscessus subsp. massiliense]